MHFLLTASALLAAAGMALGQSSDGFDNIFKPAKDEQIQAGTSYTIEWNVPDGTKGPVTIDLMGGSSNVTMNVLNPIGKAVENSDNKFVWAVDKSLGSLALYGLRITTADGAKMQYSMPFRIIPAAGTSPSPTSSTEPTTTGTTGTASSDSAVSTTTTSQSSTSSSSPSTLSTASPTKSTSTTTGSVGPTGSGGATGASPTTNTTNTAKPTTGAAAAARGVAGGMAAVFLGGLLVL